MKTEIVLLNLVNYRITDKEKITQHAEAVCKALGGLSYNEAAATLEVAKAMCEDYCLLKVEERE